MLKEHDFKDRKELTDQCLTCMKKFHGIGLNSQSSWFTFNMFVAGGHHQLKNGKSIACIIL